MLGLSYRLRSGVRVLDCDGAWFIVSRTPLKALSVSPGLGRLLRKAELGTHLRPLAVCSHHDSADRLDRLLYRLVKEGFLVESASHQTPSADLPSVTVIIPVRNRPDDLADCLSSLGGLSYPADKMQVMVVDDASTDNTAKVAERFGVTVISNRQRRGASACRNLAARAAKGGVLCFLDSDCTVHPDWLLELVRVFEDPSVTACGGLVDSVLTASGLDRYEQMMSSLRMGESPRDSRRGDAFFYLPSCNFAVRRGAFERLGGFNQDMEVGEDVDLCWRLIDDGGVIEYRPSAVVYHRHRNRIGAFCGRRFDYGTSEPMLQREHGARKKRLPIRLSLAAFWFSLTAGILWHPALIGLAAAGVAAGAWRRRAKAAEQGLPLSWPLALAAAGRVQLGGLHELASFVSRYYLLPLTLAAPFAPALAAAGWLAHLGVGLTAYFIKRPRLDPARFCFYFTLEQLSYQAGVWAGCLRSVFFRPVFPALAWPGWRAARRTFGKRRAGKRERASNRGRFAELNG